MSVEIIPPSNELQKKIGGPASRLITREGVAKAHANVEALRPPIQAEVARMLEEITKAARIRDSKSRDTIWNNAHEIRGLAGSAGRVKLGEIADILCNYLFSIAKEVNADANLITTITVAALHTLKDEADGDAMVALLIDDCRRAAKKQCEREGRIFGE